MREALKRRMVDYKGGECELCGYAGCIRALCFHHIGEKRFDIAGSHCRSWEAIRRELDECLLLCQNCHAEVHSGIVTVGSGF